MPETDAGQVADGGAPARVRVTVRTVPRVKLPTMPVLPVMLRTVLARLLLALLAHVPLAAHGQVPARACTVVTDLSGSATVYRPGEHHALAVLDYLATGEELHLAPAATVELVFFCGSGRVYTLGGPGRFALRAAAPVALDARGSVVARDLSGDWSALQRDPTDLGRASVSLRGTPDSAVELLAPIGTVRAAGAERLRWVRPYSRVADAWSYELRVVDAAGALIFTTRTRATDAAWPGPGARGCPCLWAVLASTPDGRRAEGSAEFRLLDAPAQQRIEVAQQAARRARAGRPGEGAVAEDVLLGLLLDAQDLRIEARAQWRTLAQRRPSLRPRALAAAGP